jgi:DNA-binding transcriptional LysR family regulator
VEIGSGISIVPEPSVTQEIKAETLKAIQFTDEVLIRPLGIISKRSRHFTPAVQEFIDFLQGKRPRGTTGESDRTLQATA